MVRKKGKYICFKCGFEYADKKWASRCEAWCSSHNSCSMEVIKHAIRR